MLYAANRRVSRARVSLQVLRGFNPTEPGRLSLSLPPKAGEAILSGMVLKVVAGEFVKATDADAAATAANDNIAFFLALHDQDSHDVQAAGVLVGLDCSDNYEVQTGYYETGTAFAVNDALTVATGGLVAKAAEGEQIIGYVTKIGTATANALPYVGKTPPTATVANGAVLQFKTERRGRKLADA